MQKRNVIHKFYVVIMRIACATHIKYERISCEEKKKDGKCFLRIIETTKIIFLWRKEK